MKPGTIVEIEWVDAACESSELKEGDIDFTLPIVSTWGYLIRHDEEQIVVAAERLAHTDKNPPTYRGITQIPAGWKVKMRRLA